MFSLALLGNIKSISVELQGKQIYKSYLIVWHDVDKFYSDILLVF